MGEQGEEQFTPRKSTLSQSISLQKLAHQNTQNPANPSSAAYNNDYLAQLKASTPTRTTLAREPDVIVPYDDDDTTGADTTAGIPDEATITSAITRRRRRALEPTAPPAGEEDYISLSADTSKLAVYDPSSRGPHPESRLARESDSEGSGDEALASFTGSHERLGLGKAGNEAAARRMRREMRDAVDDGLDQGDEDEERWEVEQVKRAGAVVETAAQEISSYTSAKSTSRSEKA
jgi:GC-rich sequence DNA-binding factor